MAVAFDPWAAGARLGYKNPHFVIKDALYTPATGAPKLLPVRRVQADETVDLLSIGARQPAVVFAVETRLVTVRPVEGDTLEVSGATYRIMSAEPDERAVLWRLDVELV